MRRQGDLTAQQVWRDVERVVAVSCRLVFLGPDHFDAVLAQQPDFLEKVSILLFYGLVRTRNQIAC